MNSLLKKPIILKGKMQRINILFIVTKLELGGAQKQLLELIRNLDKEKFRPFLFTASDGLLVLEAEEIYGLTIEKSRSLERPINPWKDLLACLEMYSYIKRNYISIVHTHSSKAGILGRVAARLAGAKIVLHTVHGWPFHDYQSAISRKAFIGLEKLAGKFSDRIIVVSRHDLEKGITSGIAGAQKYQLIRYGIDFAEFKRRSVGFKDEFGIAPDEAVVTNISCFKPQKSCLDFVKLVALVSKLNAKTKFILVGDGPMRSDIEKLKNKLVLGGRLILTGWRRDIPEILSITDCLVSTSFWEGLPIVVLEAMVCGCPVVVTDTGGVREVVSDGETGFFVPCGDMEQMSLKVASLLQDEGLKRKINQRAKDSLGDDFSLSRMLKSHQELYENLIFKKGKENAN